MSTSPSCTTPVSLRPVSPSAFDQFPIEDDSFDFGLVTSPGSKRCPTFKDYAEKIKQLQQENFQLRVRIYLNEQKAGVKTSSSDLAVLYSHLPQLQNAGTNGNPNNLFLGPSHSTVHTSPSTSSASAFESLNHELDKLKVDKEQLAESISQVQEKLNACEENLSLKQKKISELTEQNEELKEKTQNLIQELSSANSAIQKLNENHCMNQTGQNNDAEVERLACFAFGQNDDVEMLTAEWETKIQEKTDQITKLELELDYTSRKLETADKKINTLKSDLRWKDDEKLGLKAKIQEMSDSLKAMGERYVKATREVDKLHRKLKIKEETSESLDKIALTSNSNADKLCAIQQVVGMLQSRLKELTSFVETLLQLESKKVFTLTGLTDENRENLLKSVQQSRMLSESLDQLLEKDHIPESQYLPINYFTRSHDQSYHHENYLHKVAGHSRSMFTALDRISLKHDGVQCNILDSSLLSSLESANVYINRLKQDIATLEKINVQLNQEKADLLSQVKSLESSLNILRMANHDKSDGVEIANSKVREDNRKLTKRLTVTEDALRHLHTQHAKLVGELKTLRSTYQKHPVGNPIADSSRPSDSTSPDLGIDSGHDGAMNSDDSNGNNYKEENRILRTTNRELALKLKQTRQALDITLEKLNSTTKEKEQVEKAICRQLHKTHTILRQAKRSVEKFTNSQCQENIMPPS